MIFPSDITRRREVITVTLAKSDHMVMKQFKCPVCGHIVFEYMDDISGIITGDMEEADSYLPKYVQCRGYLPPETANNPTQRKINCKIKYLLQ